jgi:inhibitor of KinA sporulation pathway (predicted exonuclease)
VNLIVDRKALPGTIAVIDLEWTTNAINWPWAPRDILEIGGCELDLRTGHVGSFFSTDVRPTSEGVSRRCTQLTGIDPSRAANGAAFIDAVLQLREHFAHCAAWASFGVMDRVRLEQQCLREGGNFPLPPSHLDIQAIAMERFGWWRRRSLLRTLAALKRPFVGSHHSALADATNAAYVFRDVLKPGNN